MSSLGSSTNPNTALKKTNEGVDQKSKPIRRKNKKNRRKIKNAQMLRQNKTKEKVPQPTTTYNMASAQQLWHQMYSSAVRWHSTHQAEYWRLRALDLKQENDALKEMRKYGGTDDGYSDDSSDETTSSEEDAVDEGYLAFLEVSQRHQIEMKIKREAESSENN